MQLHYMSEQHAVLVAVDNVDSTKAVGIIPTHRGFAHIDNSMAVDHLPELVLH
jgi:hypothetical protein